MARIKVELPDLFTFKTIIPVRITDLNYGGHVGNDSFLSIIHEARVQFLKENNMAELSADGPGLIMTDVVIEFKKELNYGDMVSVSISADNLENFSFTLYYLLEKIAVGKNETVAKAQTGMLKYDYKLKRITK